MLGPNGEIVLLDENGSRAPVKFDSVNRGYENANKKIKETVSAQIDSDPVIDPTSILLAYNIIFAIDTNTKSIPGSDAFLSVSVAIEVLKPIKHTKDLWECRFGVKYTDIFSPFDANMAEKIGISRLIPRIIESKGLNLGSKQRVAIITDHDLGNHRHLNSQQSPLLHAPPVYIPYNFRLIYARADRHTRNESVPNLAVSLCDQFARARLDQELGRPETVEYMLSKLAKNRRERSSGRP